VPSYSGVLSFGLKADVATHNKFVNSLEIIVPAVSIGHEDVIFLMGGELFKRGANLVENYRYFLDLVKKMIGR